MKIMVRCSLWSYPGPRSNQHIKGIEKQTVDGSLATPGYTPDTITSITFNINRKTMIENNLKGDINESPSQPNCKRQTSGKSHSYITH